jgi:hypothetical protein
MYALTDLGSNGTAVNERQIERPARRGCHHHRRTALDRAGVTSDILRILLLILQLVYWPAGGRQEFRPDRVPISGRHRRQASTGRHWSVDRGRMPAGEPPGSDADWTDHSLGRNVNAPSTSDDFVSAQQALLTFTVRLVPGGPGGTNGTWVNGRGSGVGRPCHSATKSAWAGPAAP